MYTIDPNSPAKKRNLTDNFDENVSAFEDPIFIRGKDEKRK